MKRTHLHIFSVLLFVVAGFMLSCEKDITIDLPAGEEKIVVEGYIEQGKRPYVILTKNSPYFATLDSAALINLLIDDATVYVDNGTEIDTMRLEWDFNQPIPITYRTQSMVGEVGKSYKLTVVAEGKTITATTTIPTPIALDSSWFQVEPATDTLGFLWAHLSDPDTLGNYYRWFAKRLGKDKRFLPPFSSIFEDKFINGKSFDLGYDRGSEPNSTADDDNNEERGFFKVGDVVVIKFCTIDRKFFDFLRTFETEIGSNGNPFASPTIIQSNIEGGLGVWGGYGVTIDTVYAEAE